VGVIAWMHTFSPAKMWIQGLDALRTPLLHLHTQADVALPWSTIDMDFMNLNQAAHGDREFGYIATRLGVDRKTVVGHASDPAVQEQIGRWARAATGWAEMRSLRLARFGDNMRDVAVTEGDKTEAELRLGVSVNTWGVNDLVAVVDAVEEQDVDALVTEYETLYDVADELRRGGERHESLRYGARQELGLRRFLEVGGFGAFTTNFQDLGGLRQLPGLAVQRLMADGYGFGAEGDWKTAILVRVAAVMGHGLPGGASLMEDYTYEMTPGKEKILGAHMLEVSPTLTTRRPTLEIHPLGIGDREDPVRLKFSADAGPAVVVALSDMRERFRLVANVVEVVEPDEELPKLPVACAVWEPAPDFRTSATCWLTAGAAHHTVMSTAVGLEVWEDLATIADIELAIIDESTTVRSFAQDLRTHQVFHRLAQGF
jgi:L-arabinose isomerase